MKKDVDTKLIALVDDDPTIVSTVSDYFEKIGFAVEGFSNAEGLFNFLHTKRPDIVLLDIVLPDMNGFQICKTLRESEQFSSIPIIILSGQDKENDRIFGLDLGADDYMTKPYSLDELHARVNSVLRRRAMEDKGEQIDVSGKMTIDLQKFQVIVSGKSAGLTPTEFKIVQLLASKTGQVFTRDQILNHLWGDEKIVVERSIDVHIRHLREKLGEAGDLILMVRGVGYMIEENRQ